MSPLRSLLLALSGALLLTGCPQPGAGQQGPPAATPTPQPPPVRSLKTPSGNYAVRYIPSPDPVPTNEHFTVELTIERVGGELPADLAVAVDADMPAHGHGMNTQPEVTPQGKGVYQVKGLLFHMPGEWELYVDVGQGAEKERAVFPLVLE